MGQFTGYSAVTDVAASDVLLVDGTTAGGTKTITGQNLARSLAGRVSSINRRNVYRGIQLGTSIDDIPWSKVSDGTFEGLFIGDYVTISSVNWRIWDMDYFYNVGDTAFTTHHLVLVPDTGLYTAQMNSTNITEGAYVGSEMYTTNLEDAKTTISNIFGDYLLTHRDYLPNAVTDGAESAGAWMDSTVELMNSIQLYGSRVRCNAGNYAVTTTGHHQFAAARLNSRMINIRASYWLRDVYSAANFAYANAGGHAGAHYASDSYGVRPYFLVGVAA